jgi:hypothetical protein
MSEIYSFCDTRAFFHLGKSSFFIVPSPEPTKILWSVEGSPNVHLDGRVEWRMIPSGYVKIAMENDHL